MNIVLVNSTHKWGGVKTWYLELAAFLAAQGHTVTLFARSGPFLDKAVSLGLDARPFTFGPDLNPVSITRFLRVFRSRRTQLLIVNVGKDLRTAGVAARLLGIPIVQRIGSEGDLRNRGKTRLEMRLFGQVLFTVCEDIKAKLLRKIPFLEQDSVRVLYSGKIPLDTPPDRGKADPLRLVTASQLVACKGLPHLLQALRTAKLAGRDLRYTALGNGPQEQVLHALSRTLDLDDVVCWKGFSSAVSAHLQEADVFLLPSLEEGVPQGLLEAMACGLVPVASRVGGIPEIWPAGLPEEFLIPVSSLEQGLVAALERICMASEREVLDWKRIAWEHVRTRYHAHKRLQLVEQELLTLARGKGKAHD